MDKTGLKIGDVIDVVKGNGSPLDCNDCVFYGSCRGQCDKCRHISFKLRTGPKQGDTVWSHEVVSVPYGSGKTTDENRRWFKGTYVGKLAKDFIVWREDAEEFERMTNVTTTNPYALKYELTPQEALVAIGQGKMVRGEKFGKCNYLAWNAQDGVCMRDTVTTLRTPMRISVNQLYAIVEE